MKNLSTNTNRLYYLDWLRVLAFSILLFEHCAELFVPWDFWVKNNESSTVLGYFITALKPWRMPLLFIVSGAAVYLACKRKNAMEIFKERTVRILLPLVVAMFLVIPPQIYFIKIQEGYQGSFWQFYLSVFNFSWFPKGNLHWLHLWYLAFIFG
ncbi:MAG TPA: acyltransferase family protein, partial [Sphingobacteriaceae bacterium]